MRAFFESCLSQMLATCRMAASAPMVANPEHALKTTRNAVQNWLKSANENVWDAHGHRIQPGTPRNPKMISGLTKIFSTLSHKMHTRIGRKSQPHQRVTVSEFAAPGGSPAPRRIGCMSTAAEFKSELQHANHTCTFLCPAHCARTSFAVFGIGPFRLTSSICRAAAFAGIDSAPVTLQFVPHVEHLVQHTRNGVATHAWNWPTEGFKFVGCARGGTGEVCSAHGSCDPVSKACTCNAGWVGDTCERRACRQTAKGVCNARGSCKDGACICHKPYFGNSCELTRCGSGFTLFSSSPFFGTSATRLRRRAEARRARVLGPWLVRRPSRCLCVQRRLHGRIMRDGRVRARHES